MSMRGLSVTIACTQARKNNSTFLDTTYSKAIRRRQMKKNWRSYMLNATSIHLYLTCIGLSRLLFRRKLLLDLSSPHKDVLCFGHRRKLCPLRNYIQICFVWDVSV